MKGPRWAAGLGQADGLTQSLNEVTANGAACIFVFLKRPLKPLKPISYSPGSTKTPSSTAKTVEKNGEVLVESAPPQNPPITSVLLATQSSTLPPELGKTAPSGHKPLTLPQRVEASSPEVLGGTVSIDRSVSQGGPLPVIPFTPDPGREYAGLCEYAASLEAYLERERAALRATGEGRALDELGRLLSAMLDRISELHAQGAHLTGTAGGQS